MSKVKGEAEWILGQCSDDPEINVFPNWPDTDVSVLCHRVLILAEALEGMAQSKQEKFKVVRDLAREALKRAEEVK
jgi:hypothetical protein